MKGGVYRMLTKKDINTLFMLAGKRKICNFFIGEDGNE